MKKVSGAQEKGAQVVDAKGGHWAVHLYMCTFIEFKSKKCVHLKDIRMDDRTMFQNKKRYENQ